MRLKKTGVLWLLAAMVMMVLACTSGTDAAEETDTFTLTGSGFSFTKTDRMKTAAGTLTYNEYGSLDGYVGGRGIVLGEFIYQGLTADEIEQIQKEQSAAGLSEERIAQIRAACQTLFLVFGIDEGRGEQQLLEAIDQLFGEGTIQAVNVKEVGAAGGYTFYFVQDDISDKLESMQAGMGDYYQEFLQLYGDADAMAGNISVFEPVSQAQMMIGKKAEFEALDLDGNPVTSEELFSGNKVTMVNIWATWCHFCVEEMPELAKLSQELAEQGCGIAGICTDASGDELIATAKGILDDAGVTYPNVAHFEGDEQILPPSGYPTTYFVDSEGRVLTEPVYGADLEGYRARMEEALALVESAAASEEVSEAGKEDSLSGGGSTAEQAGTTEEEQGSAAGAAESVTEAEASADAAAAEAYVATVVDQNGDPVPGAILLMCSDDTCMTCECDENGVWVQTGEPCAYHVQILTVPEGYSFDETYEYTTAEEYETFTVEVVKD